MSEFDLDNDAQLQKAVLNELVYELVTGSDPMGYLLRITLVPFTGSDISYIIENDLEFTPEECEAEIEARKKEFVRELLKTHIEYLTSFSIFVMPDNYSYALFTDVLREDYQAEETEVGGKPYLRFWDNNIISRLVPAEEPKVIWEGCPNSGYPGNIWKMYKV